MFYAYYRLSPGLNLFSSLRHLDHTPVILRGWKSPRFGLVFRPQSHLTHSCLKKKQHMENLKHDLEALRRWLDLPFTTSSILSFLLALPFPVSSPNQGSGRALWVHSARFSHKYILGVFRAWKRMATKCCSTAENWSNLMYFSGSSVIIFTIFGRR